MKRLTAYFVVLSLSLVSSASTDKESKVYSKNFNFGKRDVLLSLKPFWKNQMVYAVNEGSDADQKWKVYVETSNLDQNTVDSCDVNLKYNGDFYFNVALFNAGNSKAIFVVRDGENKIKLISVYLKGCQIKEASLDIPKVEISRVIVVPHDNNYDVVFNNKQLCNGFICKVTLNYEGEVVKAASEFLLKDEDFTISQIESNRNGYLVIVSYHESTKVYLVNDKDNKANALFRGSRKVHVALSAEENKHAYCAIMDQKLGCKQYDTEGKTEEIEFETSISAGRMESLDVYNLEKGLLVLPVETVNYKRKNDVLRFDKQGKKVKSVNIDLKCHEYHVLFPKMYKKNEQYCVTSICLDAFDAAQFSRSTRCFFKSELF